MGNGQGVGLQNNVPSKCAAEFNNGICFGNTWYIIYFFVEHLSHVFMVFGDNF